MPSTESVAVRFGENLRRCRRRAGISQERLAVAAAVHRTEIGLLENGRRVARADTFVKLACCLEIPADELLDGIACVPGTEAPGSFALTSRVERGTTRWRS
jgi:transcriptional regulator with XRE-family HTH domain